MIDNTALISLLGSFGAVLVVGVTIFFRLNASLKEWRKEHREDMNAHRAEVSQALQTIAEHSVRITHIEDK